MHVGRHTDGQHTHEKVLGVAQHQGNANHNYQEREFTSVRMATIKKIK